MELDTPCPIVVTLSFEEASYTFAENVVIGLVRIILSVQIARDFQVRVIRGEWLTRVHPCLVATVTRHRDRVCTPLLSQQGTLRG